VWVLGGFVGFLFFWWIVFLFGGGVGFVFFCGGVFHLGGVRQLFGVLGFRLRVPRLLIGPPLLMRSPC